MHGRQGIGTVMEKDEPVGKPKSGKLGIFNEGQTGTDTVNLTNNEVNSLDTSECLFLTTIF